MKPYISATFLFLVLSWYEVSGGAEFEARDISHRMKPDPFAEKSSPMPEPRRSSPMLLRARGMIEPTTNAQLNTQSMIHKASMSSTEFAATGRELQQKDAALFSGSEAEQESLVRISADRLNIRFGPGTNFASFGVLDRGELLIVLREKKQWKKVKAESNGRVGWVAGWLTEPIR